MSNRIPSFLIGLGVGATFGLLVAPHRGEKTRQELRRTVEDGREIIGRGTKEFRQSAEKAVEWSRDVLETRRMNLETAYQAGVEAYRRTVDGT